MSKRKIQKMVQGQPAVDGAGVRLVRVLGHDTTQDYDPFLMLDSFDSYDQEDYTKGFPMHPHRGIETITYLISGRIDHEDSLGNKGTIGPGESQWMTAGSGIMHQEMPQASERMLGFQLWLNLPQKDKMAYPHYFDIKADLIGETQRPGAKIRVITGELEGVKGAKPLHIPASLYDVALEPGASVTLPTRSEDTVFVFLIEGEAVLEGQTVPQKTAVLYGEGDSVTLQAPEGSPARIIFYAGRPLHEGIAWGGPIVMNTEEELRDTFRELREGTFIKHDAVAEA